MSRTLLLAACATLIGTAASASPIVSVTNTTDVVSYSQGSAYNYFNNGTSDVGPYVGSNYQTTGLTASVANAGGGMEALTLAYTTAFNGSDQVNGYNINYADIFLQAGNADFAISLGDQTANGGVASGFYTNLTGVKSSQDIWSGRSGLVYGGGFTYGGQTYGPSPTVLTGGTRQGSAAFSQTALGNGFYTVSETIDLTAAEAALFANGFDAFWGTGDCANGAFLAVINGLGGVGVPEPASFALLGVGLVGFGLARRRRGISALAA